jgi:hypothetical protein
MFFTQEKGFVDIFAQEKLFLMIFTHKKGLFLDPFGIFDTSTQPIGLMVCTCNPQKVSIPMHVTFLLTILTFVKLCNQCCVSI